jgi:hypothetical protein
MICSHVVSINMTVSGIERRVVLYRRTDTLETYAAAIFYSNMEAADFSETTVLIYPITRRHFPEINNLCSLS